MLVRQRFQVQALSRSISDSCFPGPQGTDQLFVGTIRAVKVPADSRSVKSVSIRVASVVPTLPNVPRQPRGELNSP